MTDDTPPELPPPDRPAGIAGMLEGLNVTLNELERCMAGYNTLTRVYQTVTGQLAPGQRAKGLMLSFKGSVDDTHAIDVNIDLQKHVNPEHVAHVVAPLANGQAHGMLAAVEQLLKEATELRGMIRSALGYDPKTGQPAPPAAPAA